MPAETKRLDARLYHTYWSGKLTADDILADQARGNRLAQDAHEDDYGLIIEFAKGTTFSAELRLIRTVFLRDQTPAFVVIVGATSPIRIVANTIQKLFVHSEYFTYADNLDKAIVEVKQKLLALDKAKVLL